MFSQAILCIDTACNLMCLGCSTYYLNSEIQFFGNSKAKLINIVGGEVFFSSKYLNKIKQLKADGKKIRLWTNLLVDEQQLKLALPYVDDWVIYFPISSAGFYRRLTGVDAFSRLKKNIQVLKSLNASCFLHMPVATQTIDFVPYVHEFSRENLLHLILTYQNETLNKEQISYLKRFNKVSSVYLFKNKKTSHSLCSVFPFSIIFDPLQWGINLFFELLPGYLR